MATVVGQRVTLRAFREDEVELVHRARSINPEGLVAQASLDQLRERIVRSGKMVGGRLDMAIEADGRLVGEVDARQPKFGLPPGVYEIGIGIFSADDRSKGLGREAFALLTDHLFDAHDAERVQASTWVENAAMRRVLERLGFKYEGTMRGFMPSPRGRDDYAMYGITRFERREAKRSETPFGFSPP
jgi:RimJ/RimL family protein N-acetyltransferase